MAQNTWERFGDYTAIDEDKEFEYYYGCSSDPLNGIRNNGSRMREDQINDRDQLICRNIKDIRLTNPVNRGGEIKGIYGNWFIWGQDYGNNRPFEGGYAAWNISDGWHTGLINCDENTKPTGTKDDAFYCNLGDYENFKNYIYSVSPNFRTFARYDLDTQTEVYIDISEQGIVGNSNYIIFKDLVMVDVTESSTGDRLWLEINFDGNFVEQRGVIEDGGLKVLKFIK